MKIRISAEQNTDQHFENTDQYFENADQYFENADQHVLVKMRKPPLFVAIVARLRRKCGSVFSIYRRCIVDMSSM